MKVDAFKRLFFLLIRKLTYPDGTEYFTYHLDTAWDLYVLTTTANHPDVM